MHKTALNLASLMAERDLNYQSSSIYFKVQENKIAAN
jgi:hypothetical protein